MNPNQLKEQLNEMGIELSNPNTGRIRVSMNDNDPAIIRRTQGSVWVEAFGKTLVSWDESQLRDEEQEIDLLFQYFTSGKFHIDYSYADPKNPMHDPMPN